MGLKHEKPSETFEMEMEKKKKKKTEQIKMHFMFKIFPKTDFLKLLLIS